MHIAENVRATVGKVAPGYKLHIHEDVRETAQYVQLGFPLESMVKAMVFRAEDRKIVVVAIPATAAVDYGAVARYVGIARSKLVPADAADIELLGMEQGGVSPFVEENAARVLVDERIARMAVVFCGSGKRTGTLEVGGAQLCAIPGAQPGPFAKVR